MQGVKWKKSQNVGTTSAFTPNLNADMTFEILNVIFLKLFYERCYVHNIFTTNYR